MEDKEGDLRDEVENITTTTFSIAGIKIKQFKRFLEFGKDNAVITKIFHDRVTGEKQVKEEICYALAIQRLLDIAEFDVKTQMLWDKITVLENRIAELELKYGSSVPKKKEIKTMGHKDEVKEE